MYMIYTDVAFDVHMDACRSYIEMLSVIVNSLVTVDPIHRIGYRINPPNNTYLESLNQP